MTATDFAALIEASARAHHEAKRARGVALAPWERMPAHRRQAALHDMRAALIEASRLTDETERRRTA